MTLIAAAAVSAVLFLMLFIVFTASHNIENMNWTRCWYVFLFALGMASADFGFPAQRSCDAAASGINCAGSGACTELGADISLALVVIRHLPGLAASAR